MKTISAKQFEELYGTEAKNFFTQTEEKKAGYLQRVRESITQTGKDLASDLQTQADTAAVTPGAKKLLSIGRGGLRTAGAFAEAALTPVMEAPGIKQATEFVGEKISETTPIKKYAEWAQKHPEAAKDIENTLDIAGLFGAQSAGKAIGKTANQVARSTASKVQAGAKSGVETGKQLIEKGRGIAQPPIPTAKEAMGQVLQGKTKDISSGFKALRNVDTSGVKTYRDLFNRVEGSIKNLSTKVDETLDNTTPIGLDDLKLTGKTASGETMSIDYLSRALDHLKELYMNTGDDITAKNIDDLINKAKTQGLTRLEVNNLARQYGQEFGEKAFSKMGDPLTSVNAVRFENTRKALKKIARQGMGGKEAQKLDESISSLYRVKDLIKKNVDAVNKLNQKIQQRGILEKFGHVVAKTADIATGGTIRGIVGGLLPRGVGYKVMNALDLEQALERNLKAIMKAMKKLPNS